MSNAKKETNKYVKQDSLWKDAIETFFYDFLEFFAPDIFNLINTSKEPEYLEQELNKLYYGTKTKDRRTDKLVRVYLKDNSEKWILCHIEVQGYNDTDFGKRMFQYFYRILDKYDKDTFVIAIFSDNDKNYQPNIYKYKFFDTELAFKYRSYKILEQEEEKLKISNNPFAFVVLTALYLLKTNGKNDLKYNSKVKLYKLLRSEKWGKDNISKLFSFMDNMLSLPTELKDKFKEDIKIINEDGEVAMGLSVKDSETGKLIAKDIYIEMAKKMLRANKDVKEILEFTELTEEEFQKEVIDKIQKEKH